MSLNLSCTATFEALPPSPKLSILLQGDGLGRVTSNPGGIDCDPNCVKAFAEGQSLILIGTPAAGSAFAGFSGNDPRCANSPLIMNTDLECIATFDLLPPPSRFLEIILQGTGSGTISSTPLGLDCVVNCTGQFEQGSTVSLSAPPAAGSVFAGFSGDDLRCGNAAIVMDTDLQCFATFDLLPTPSRTLKITLDGTGLGTITSNPLGIDCGLDCTALFDQDSAVVLNANPAPGSRFAGFSGDAACTALSPLSLTMIVDINCTATFEAIPPSPRLSILLQGTGLGSVTSSPAGIDCGVTCSELFARGRGVTLTATPVAGSEFLAFSGNACSGFSPLSLIVDADLTCIASFKAIAPSPTLTILLQGTGGGTVTSSPGGINCGTTCTEVFAQGRRITLTATPAEGSIFARFTGPPGCADTSFVMGVDRTCTAVFELAIIAP